MRIAITHPYYWPYVRRGSERYAHDLSQYLADAGHEVDLITSKPGFLPATARDGKVEVIYYPQLTHHFWGDALMTLAKTTRAIQRRRLGTLSFKRPEIDEKVTFAYGVFLSTLAKRYDLVYCVFFADCLGVRLHQALSKRPYVLFFAGIPIAEWFTPLNLRLLRLGLHSASRAVVASRIAGRYMETDFGVKPEVMPPGIRMADFAVGPRRDIKNPVVLCVSSPEVPEKNVPLLVRAFDILKRQIPGAKLEVCASSIGKVSQGLPALASPPARDSIEIIYTSDTAKIAEMYANASVTVQPACYESFGLVLAESLACGTPVVGARSGALPELVDDPRIGSLVDVSFNGNGPTEESAENLCGAILEALKLNEDPNTRDRCRRHASRYDWSVLGPRIESLFGKVSKG